MSISLTIARLRDAEMSCPAEKCGPLALSTMTRTSLSAAAMSQAPSSSRNSCGFCALRRSGRFKVMTATRSTTSYRMNSISDIAFPDSAVGSEQPANANRPNGSGADRVGETPGVTSESERVRVAIDHILYTIAERRDAGDFEGMAALFACSSFDTDYPDAPSGHGVQQGAAEIAAGF